MVAYVCKYAPAEVLAGFSQEAVKIRPEDFLNADVNIPAGSVCPCARAALAGILQGDFSELIMTASCSCMKKIAAMAEQSGRKKVYLLDMPSPDAQPGEYEAEIKKFIQSYVVEHNVGLDMEKFTDKLQAAPRWPDFIHVAITGCCVPQWFIEAFNKMSTIPLVDYTCMQPVRYFDNIEDRGGTAALSWYASQLLAQVPGSWVRDEVQRENFLKDKNIYGLLNNTMSGCDYYNSEYMSLLTEVPVERVNVPLGKTMDKAVISKLHAFLKTNGWLKPLPKPAGAAVEQPAPSSLEQSAQKAQTIPSQTERVEQEIMEGDFYAGIDSGSATTKVVILDKDKKIIASGVMSTGGSPEKSAHMVLNALLTQKKIPRASVKKIVATGEGRNAVPSDADISEINCQAKGVSFIFPGVSTVIDVGGREYKLIQVDSDGKVMDFIMNENCAAGTGKFLEMTAKRLNIRLNDFSSLNGKWKEDLAIKSTCAVFMEGEVQSFISQGKQTADIIHAVNGALAKRFIGIIASEGYPPAYVLTGGVARDSGLVAELSDRLGEPIFVPDDPQTTSALGAALFALEA